MVMYEEWLSKDIPQQLYHYTTKEGFLGIIKNKQLWASHILYQNDYTEYELALDILKETIKSQENKLKKYSVNVNTLFDDAKKNLTKSFYIVSLSEEKDILSQWRGCANSMPGFCIGFRRYSLLALKENNKNIVIAKCIYEKQKQKDFISELLQDSVNKINDIKKDPNETLSDQIAWRMIKYAPLFKHEKFSEENEWRIIIPNIDTKDENFDIRVGKTYFIPYFKLNFKCQEAIGDIIIGPCPDKKITYDSTLFACYANHIEFGKLKSRELFQSEIPFRNW